MVLGLMCNVLEVTKVSGDASLTKRAKFGDLRVEIGSLDDDHQERKGRSRLVGILRSVAEGTKS